jgi:tetratricopeptide (TPR) repeat protein
MNDIERIQAEQAIQEAKQALRNGLREQAREMASRSLELNPQNEEPWLILAALADTQASIEYLKIALQINPDSNRAKHGMQWALERARKEKMQDQPLVIADNMQL